MNQESPLSLPAVLRTVVYLLEVADYPGKGGNAVADLITCIRRTITELELAGAKEA
jgi:hypothetical protein